MDPLFKKLAFKDHPEIMVLHAPESFQLTLKNIPVETTILQAIDQINQILYAIVFVTQKIEIQHLAQSCQNKLSEDATVWICYPKGSSKKYSCDFNRDKGWEPMGEIGYEPVSQVAIDEDWSALRFRNVHFIKSLKRNPDSILSQEGKKGIQ